MSEHWRYDECSVAFYHEGIETDMYKVVDALNAAEARIAELEGKFDQLTARWRQERQDDKWIPVSEPPKECEMRVFKDGDAWCFVLPDFQDLQASPSVWMKKGVLDKIYKELRSVRDE